MTRGIRATLVIGAALMAAGCVLPWGRLWMLGVDDITVVHGFGRGAEWVLALAAVIVMAAVAGLRWPAVVAAGSALVVGAYAAAVLPDHLHDEGVASQTAGGGIYATFIDGSGPWQASTGVGLTFAMLGALVACAGAVAIVVRWAREAPSAAVVAPERA